MVEEEKAVIDWIGEMRHADRPELWGPTRKNIRSVIEHPVLENLITAIILYNILVIVVETDQTADNGTAAGWIEVSNMVLLVIYTVEIGFRLFTWRLQFFFDGWNIIDFAVVAVDLTFVMLANAFGGMPSVAMVRMFRLLKLARALRAMKSFTELRLLLKSFLGAFRAIFWGSILTFVIILMLAILSVQLLHPINNKVTASGYYDRVGCERCPKAFKTVFDSSVTIFQTAVIGDDWAGIALPMIEENSVSLLYFFIIFITIGMGIWNLILAIICDTAQAAREEDEALIAEEEIKQFKIACYDIREKCRSMDVDGSGTLSKAEMIAGFDTNADYACTMKSLGFSKNRAEFIMAAFDADGSGDVSYDELLDTLIDHRNNHTEESWVRELQTLVLSVKMIVTEVQKNIVDLRQQNDVSNILTAIPKANTSLSESAQEANGAIAPFVAASDRDSLGRIKTMPNSIGQVNELYGSATSDGIGNLTGVATLDLSQAPRTATTRAAAPAPQAPPASPQGRAGYTKRLSTSLSKSFFTGASTEKE